MKIITRPDLQHAHVLSAIEMNHLHLETAHSVIDMPPAGTSGHNVVLPDLEVDMSKAPVAESNDKVGSKMSEMR